jgi:DNA-binding beta-propeller fold protein YncE
MNLIRITPDGKTAYATWGNVVVPIDTATNMPGRPIRVRQALSNLAITPDGKTVYVLLNSSGLTAISTATDQVPSRSTSARTHRHRDEPRR